MEKLMSTDNDTNKQFSIYSGNIFIYTVFITARICIDEKCVLVTLSTIALQGKLIIAKKKKYKQLPTNKQNFKIIEIKITENYCSL